ncbi:MAG: HD domain-containing protein [Candidatus Aminicenantes bacterium]|jgi:putative nucleotidyltransferase with HDIG domain
MDNRILGASQGSVDPKRNRLIHKDLNRAFETLKEGNYALVRSFTETTLLNKMCRIIVDLGGYPFVWVGFGENDLHKKVRPVVYAGDEKDYLDSIELTWSQFKKHKDPSGTAIQTGKVHIEKNLAKKNGYVPWKMEATKRGFLSSVAFPLIKDDQTFGAINIFSENPEGFGKGELVLLSALAEDLSYGIASIRTREKKKTVEEELKQSRERLQRTIEITIQALATTIEMRDPYTAGHQRRVAELASAIAEEMGLIREKVENINIAGMIHDIGKIYIPVEILTRPGRLSEYEINIIKAHPQYGRDIMTETEVPEPVAEIVHQHHERLNGSGYPEGKKSEEILLESKILSVADVVEAMSSHRPYRPALGIDVALDEIKNHRGIYYDPEVTDACLRLFEKKGYELSLESQSTFHH